MNELERLRLLEQRVKSVVTQKADDLCWRDVYTELAELVGVTFCPALIVESDQFLANCKAFDSSLRSGTYTPVYCERVRGAGKALDPKVHAARQISLKESFPEGSVWVHTKSNVKYAVLAVSEDKETANSLITYFALGTTFNWTRTMTEFSQSFSRIP